MAEPSLCSAQFRHVQRYVITSPSITWLLNNRDTFKWAPSYWDQFAIFVILAVAAALIFLLVLQLPKVAAFTGVKEQTAEQPAG